MNLLKRLSFDLSYYRQPVWDTGIIPPEVDAFIRSRPSGSALDLGCGTGTASIALAQAGWRVTGVDFASRAIALARRKAARAGVKVDWKIQDVLHLRGISGPFDLVLDIGCFHGLSTVECVDYLHNLEPLLAPAGIWLMYGFFRPDARPGPGLRPEDLEIAALHLHLARRQDGVDRKDRPSAWFWFEKK
jgi:2-polyprenyl-3-methyl-5-hydroxy-6-metoxy-1,4-benzoquinol methylase